MDISKLIKEQPDINLTKNAGEEKSFCKEISIGKLIKEYPDLSITLNAGALKSFGEEIATNAVKRFIERKDERIYNRNEVIDKFRICSATLWRWEKHGLIESRKIGNRSFYPESEIKRLMSVEGGAK